MTPHAPDTFGQNGQYKVVSPIGRGGFATVYKAYHSALDRYVAIKVLRPELVEPEGAARRFQIEARASARLAGHPNIVTVYDYGDEEGSAYLVLQFVDGMTLERRLATPISAQEIDKIITGVASALDFAHNHQLLHRDIKPSNVLLEQDGTPILSDFGIAKLLDATASMTNTLLGTPDYMSPEQITGSPLDRRSDVYALGVMIFRIFVGHPPYQGVPMSILHQHVHSAVPPMSGPGRPVPAAVEAVVRKALAKNPDDRQATAGQLADELRHALRPMILAEQAHDALDRNDVSRAEGLANELIRDHPSYPEGAILQREVARLRTRLNQRDLIARMVEAGNWAAALMEVDRAGLRGDPLVTDLTRRAEAGLAEIRSRQEAARRAEEERRAREAAAAAQRERERQEMLRRAEEERKVREAAAAAERERQRLEQERLEKERLERERLAALEKARLEQVERERAERARQERLKAEAAAKEQARLAALEKAAAEQRERERLAALEKARLEQLERDRLTAIAKAAAEQRERERLEALEKAAAAEKLRQQQRETETRAFERLAAEQLERDQPEAETRDFGAPAETRDFGMPAETQQFGLEVVGPRTPAPETMIGPISGPVSGPVSSPRLPGPPTGPVVIPESTPTPMPVPARTSGRSRGPLVAAIGAVAALAVAGAALASGVVGLPGGSPTPTPVAKVETVVPTPSTNPAVATAPVPNVTVPPPTTVPATAPPAAKPTVADAKPTVAEAKPTIPAKPTLAPTAPPTAAPTAPPPTAVAAAPLPTQIPWPDGATMALVPGGSFTMGDAGDPSTSPQHPLTIPDFYMDLTEVTNAQFTKFVQEAKHETKGDWRYFADAKNFDPQWFDTQRGEHPVVNVSWADADAYCHWANKRLPVEAEWEKAARGTDTRRWPWGNEAHPEFANVENHDEEKEPDTARVGSFPRGASPFGLLDMVGNVREWTDSGLQAYPLAQPLAPVADSATSRVTRGGSWLSLPTSIELTRRLAEPVGTTAKDLGFRCAVSADQAIRR